MTEVDYLACMHEAGHACIGQMYGFSVKHAVVHAIGARQDEAGRIELHDPNFERDSNPNRFLVFILAGAAAERKQTGHTSPRDASDREHARLMCEAYLKDATPEAVRKEIDTAETLAYALMFNDDLWRWIERTAKELARRRRLSGRDIHELREARR